MGRTMGQGLGRERVVWILSEERPKVDALAAVLTRLAELEGLDAALGTLTVRPLVADDGRFTFWYAVDGFAADGVAHVRLGIVSGTSSFVDFLVFLQPDEPRSGERPLLLIEETKTDDSESRNTGVFQRATKFVYGALHYPGVHQVMLYNLRVAQAAAQTPTNVFGTRCLRTLGVEILGKVNDAALNQPFADLDELIDARARVRRPPAGNVPIVLEPRGDHLAITGRLYKSGGLAHDPNIGAILLIAATARRLGWDGPIVASQHGLAQTHVRPRNKFVRVANRLGVGLEGLELPASDIEHPYWRYDTTSEKNASILLHVAAEASSGVRAIFENHAGSEKGYFLTPTGPPLALAKYVPGVEPRMSMAIPDLILVDEPNRTVVVIEGKVVDNVELGLRTLDNYGDVERLYVAAHYPQYRIVRSLVLFGGVDARPLGRPRIDFLLTKDGHVHIGRGAPALYRALAAKFGA